MKVKQNDTVLVITGKDRGKVGKVLKVYESKKAVSVDKVNIATKHVKKTATRAGGMIKFEKPVHVSNVKVVCPHCNKAIRVGYSVPAEGKKVRICKKCEASIDATVHSKKKK